MILFVCIFLLSLGLHGFNIDGIQLPQNSITSEITNFPVYRGIVSTIKVFTPHFIVDIGIFDILLPEHSVDPFDEIDMNSNETKVPIVYHGPSFLIDNVTCSAMAAKGILTESQCNPILEFLENHTRHIEQLKIEKLELERLRLKEQKGFFSRSLSYILPGISFSFVNVLYIFGTLLIVVWFPVTSSAVYKQSGRSGLIVSCIFFSGFFTLIAEYIRQYSIVATVTIQLTQPIMAFVVVLSIIEKNITKNDLFNKYRGNVIYILPELALIGVCYYCVQRYDYKLFIYFPGSLSIYGLVRDIPAILPWKYSTHAIHSILSLIFCFFSIQYDTVESFIHLEKFYYYLFCIIFYLYSNLRLKSLVQMEDYGHYTLKSSLKFSIESFFLLLGCFTLFAYFESFLLRLLCLFGMFLFAPQILSCTQLFYPPTPQNSCNTPEYIPRPWEGCIFTQTQEMNRPGGPRPMPEGVRRPTMPPYYVRGFYHGPFHFIAQGDATKRILLVAFSIVLFPLTYILPIPPIFDIFARFYLFTLSVSNFTQYIEWYLACRAPKNHIWANLLSYEVILFVWSLLGIQLPVVGYFTPLLFIVIILHSIFLYLNVPISLTSPMTYRKHSIIIFCLLFILQFGNMIGAFDPYYSLISDEILVSTSRIYFTTAIVWFQFLVTIMTIFSKNAPDHIAIFKLCVSSLLFFGYFHFYLETSPIPEIPMIGLVVSFAGIVATQPDQLVLFLSPFIALLSLFVSTCNLSLIPWLIQLSFHYLIGPLSVLRFCVYCDENRNTIYLLRKFKSSAEFISKFFEIWTFLALLVGDVKIAVLSSIPIWLFSFNLFYYPNLYRMEYPSLLSLVSPLFLVSFVTPRPFIPSFLLALCLVVLSNIVFYFGFLPFLFLDERSFRRRTIIDKNPHRAFFIHVALYSFPVIFAYCVIFDNWQLSINRFFVMPSIFIPLFIQFTTLQRYSTWFNNGRNPLKILHPQSKQDKEKDHAAEPVLPPSPLLRFSSWVFSVVLIIFCGTLTHLIQVPFSHSIIALIASPIHLTYGRNSWRGGYGRIQTHSGIVPVIFVQLLLGLFSVVIRSRFLLLSSIGTLVYALLKVILPKSRGLLKNLWPILMLFSGVFVILLAVYFEQMLHSVAEFSENVFESTSDIYLVPQPGIFRNKFSQITEFTSEIFESILCSSLNFVSHDDL